MTDGGSGHQPSTRPARWSGSSLPLGLCTVSAPTPEVGKEPPACPGRVPQSPPVPPTKTQLGVFTDSVTEAGTQTHHTAQQGLKVQGRGPLSVTRHLSPPTGQEAGGVAIIARCIYEATWSTTACLGREARVPSRESLPSCLTHRRLPWGSPPSSSCCRTPHSPLLLPGLSPHPYEFLSLAIFVCQSLQKTVRLGRALGDHQVRPFYSSGEDGSSERGGSCPRLLSRLQWSPGHGGTVLASSI